MSNKFLFDEHPLVIQPKLAECVGLNEAIILQQMNYWLKKSEKYFDGHVWIYNTYKTWNEQFPFFSLSTIRRTISNLEKENIIITGNYNKAGFDKTKWYTINNDVLTAKINSACVQDEQTSCSNRTDGSVQNEQMEAPNLNTPIPETTRDYSKITSENNMSGSKEQDNIPYKEIVDYLNEKTGKNFKSGTDATRRVIKARFAEKNTLADFKKVIDVKSAEWRTDAKMQRYLQPSTLFGTKFEGYLNQSTTGSPKKDLSKMTREQQLIEVMGKDGVRF